MHVHVLILAMFKVQRAITQKDGKPELWFMCSASRLIVLYSCVKFRQNKSGHKYIQEMAVFNSYYVQRATTPKVSSTFLCQKLTTAHLESAEGRE